MDIGDLISVEEVAVLAGLSVRSIYLKVDAGECPKPLKFGAAIRFRETEILQWLETRGPRRRRARATVTVDDNATV